MATATALYAVGDRLVVTAATGGFPAGALGVCVGHYWQGFTGTEAYVYVVRVQDDVDGTCDLHLLAADVTVAP